MRKPLFSIVIPTLNEEKFVPRLLSSIEKQTKKDFDVIVVDGKSKDKTLAVARSFSKKIKNLTVATCEPGVSRQRNMGAKLGKGEYLVFIDADSELMSYSIECITKYINTHQPKIFSTWCKADIDNPVYAILAFIMNIGLEAGVLINKPWAPGPLTIVRKDIFESVNGYNERVTYAEDHELGVAISRKGVSFDILRDILYIYSFRRFQKESLFKIIERMIKSSLVVIVTNRGMAHMPGFISGGSLYTKKAKKRKNPIFSTKFKQNIKQYIQDLVE